MKRKLGWAIALGVTMMACGHESPPPPPLPEGLIVAESALQDQLRQLWTERVFWSRALMISTLSGLGDRELLSARLRQNNQDLGAAFDTFYASVGAGAQLASYLDADQDHFEAALDTAAQGHHINSLKRPWKDNIKALADYLESINAELPGSVDGDLKNYVDHAFKQIEQRQVADWFDDVNAYDHSIDNALDLADALTRGFLEQYPDNVTEEPNEGYQELRTEQRKLWMDHFMWHHFLTLSGVNELPDLAAGRQRALFNQSDLGKSIKPFYDPVAGEQLSTILQDHVLNTEQTIRYTRAGDATSVLTTRVIGYAGADQLAQFLANLNPNLPLEVTRPNLKRHMDLVYDDIDALFQADFAGDLRALEELEALLLDTADAISAATQAMFPNDVNQ